MRNPLLYGIAIQALLGCYATHDRDDDAPPAALALTTPQLRVAGDHACLLIADGTVHCWGSNIFAQLGQPRVQPSHVGEPVRVLVVPGLQDIRSLSVGTNHSCAVDGEGQLYCWGSNEHGQLGIGIEESPDDCSYSTPVNKIPCSHLPVAVETSRPVSQVAAGGTHTCFIDVSDEVWCWGYMGGGEDIVDRPIPVPNTTGLASLSASPNGERASGHTCALHYEGMIQCWGTNNSSQTGPTPGMPFRLPDYAVDVLTGPGYSCGVTDVGDVYCWGYNPQSTLGIDSSPVPKAGYAIDEPTLVPHASDVVTLSTQTRGSMSSTCALLRSGAVTCWGADGSWEVEGLSDVLEISGNCARLSESIKCWGGHQAVELSKLRPIYGDSSANQVLQP